MKSNKKGMTLVEVVIGILIFSIFATTMALSVRKNYNVRTANALNKHFLSISNTLGGYLAAYNGPGDAPSNTNIFNWTGLAFTDGKAINEDSINVDSFGYSTAYVDAGGNWTDAEGNPINYSTYEEQNTYHYGADGSRIMNLTVGGSGKTITVPNGIGTISGDIEYQVRVFREINTSTEPNLVSYRIRTSLRPPYDTNGDGDVDTDDDTAALYNFMNLDADNVDGFVGRNHMIGTEVIYQKRTY